MHDTLDENRIISNLVIQSKKIMTDREMIDGSFITSCFFKYFKNKKIQKLSFFIELQVIHVYAYNLRFILGLYKSVLKLSYQANIDDYISFSRLEFNELDRISCDWCSIYNGTLIYSLDIVTKAIINKDTDVLLWAFPKFSAAYILFNLLRYIPFTAVKKYYDKDHVDNKVQEYNRLLASSFPQMNLNNLKKSIKKLIVMTHIADCVERRWCPFKHIKKLSYKTAPHHVFDSRYKDSLELAAKELAMHAGVSCYKCNDLINQKLNQDGSMNLHKLTKPCLFDELFNYMLSLQVIKPTSASSLAEVEV